MSGPHAISFQERAGKPGGGKDILIQHERTGALSTLNNQSVLCLNDQGNGDGKLVNTLTGDHQNRVTDYTARCVQEAVNVFGNSVASGLVASAYKGPGNTQDGLTVCYGLDRASFNQGQNALYDPGILEEQQQPTLTARGPGAVCGPAREGGGANEIQPHSVVRRLTPLECERLQGVPDGWTDLGEWTDSQGKRHKDADSPRYKALGNGIATPAWYWLWKRLSKEFDHPPTLGSLFDGIGTFPMIHEAINGKGTARWSSEIEEFPIAVARRRLGDEDAGIEGDGYWAAVAKLKEFPL